MRVLVTVKAYPMPSRTYDELVCTAGVLEDGSWIRIYPVPFRFLKFRKYQWIELNLIRNTKDFRPESYRPASPTLEDMKVVGHIDTKNKWAARKKFCCRNVYYSKRELIEHSCAPQNLSLATFKPSEIKEFIIEPDERDWKPKWKAQLQQLDMFTRAGADGSGPRIPIRKLPYKFRYRFVDTDGVESNLMIEDWEIGALYWNCLSKAEGDEEEALEKVRLKYWDEFMKKDIYFFLGTTMVNHARRAPNPFVIIGVFYPPLDPQSSLFS
ncbi:MAG: hypothetical protein D6746_17570 [Bacteroidetes bacterium]|nr:MAG: hypothetical protein D6746_17570 [Bacteroidota bacterium]